MKRPLLAALVYTLACASQPPPPAPVATSAPTEPPAAPVATPSVARPAYPASRVQTIQDVLHGITVAEFRGNRICSIRQHWDELSVFDQLGLLRDGNLR